MHISKVGFRFFAVLIAFAMCISLSVSALAAEMPAVTETAGTNDTVVVYSNAQVTANHLKNPVRGNQKYIICPDSGEVLKLSINNSSNPDTSDITVKVTKNGGWWPSKTITVPRGQSSKVYTLISNCNGQPYTVEFIADPGYFVGILYANVA